MSRLLGGGGGDDRGRVESSVDGPQNHANVQLAMSEFLGAMGLEKYSGQLPEIIREDRLGGRLDLDDVIDVFTELRDHAKAKAKEIDRINSSTTDGNNTQGFLYKRGHIVKNWLKRYFVLYPRKICYFENDSMARCLGTIELENVIDVKEPEPTDADIKSIKPVTKFVFVLQTLKREYYICAESRAEQEQWATRIVYVAAQCRQRVSIAGTVEDADYEVSSLEIKKEDLTWGKLLGSGAFGDVYYGNYQDMLHPVAIKTIRKEHTHPMTQREFQKEMALISKLRHPNIVMLRAASSRGTPYMMVMEYCSRGSLRTVLEDRSIDLAWPLRVKMLLDAANGIAYLHNKEPIIIHRDLKTDNLLVDEKFTVKISDFGLVRFFIHKSTENIELTGHVGTVRFMAPELMKPASGGLYLYDEKVDAFSFAMIMHEMASRRKPWEAELGRGATSAEITKLVLNGDRPKPPTACADKPQYTEVMKRCWTPSAQARPSFTAVATSLQTIKDSMPSDDEPTMPRTSSAGPAH